MTLNSLQGDSDGGGSSLERKFLAIDARDAEIKKRIRDEDNLSASNISAHS